MLRAWRGKVRELFQCVREAASLVILLGADSERARSDPPRGRRGHPAGAALTDRPKTDLFWDISPEGLRVVLEEVRAVATCPS